jgi:hypothetical protein
MDTAIRKALNVASRVMDRNYPKRTIARERWTFNPGSVSGDKIRLKAVYVAYFQWLVPKCEHLVIFFRDTAETCRAW